MFNICYTIVQDNKKNEERFQLRHWKISEFLCLIQGMTFYSYQCCSHPMLILMTPYLSYKVTSILCNWKYIICLTCQYIDILKKTFFNQAIWLQYIKNYEIRDLKTTTSNNVIFLLVQGDAYKEYLVMIYYTD